MPNFTPYTKLAKFDWFLEAVSFVLIVSSWLYLYLNFADIPETVPVHFNLYGEADGFGEKGKLYTLQYFATGLYLVMVVSGLFPQFHTIPATLTEANTEGKYKLSVQMMRWLNVIMCLIFFVMVVTSVYNALNGIAKQNMWVVLLLIVALFAVIIKYWSKLAKK